MTLQNALNVPFAATPVWTPLTLQGSWQDYGNPYPPPAYAVFLRQIFFRGVIKNGSGLFAQIPSSLAPSSNLYFKPLAADIYAYLAVDPQGNLVAYPGSNNAYIFLNQLMYLIG